MQHNQDQGLVNLKCTGKFEHTGSLLAFRNKTAIAVATPSSGNTDGEISGLAISSSYIQAEVVALRDKCEELADDVRSLRTALVNLGIVA